MTWARLRGCLAVGAIGAGLALSGPPALAEEPLMPLGDDEMLEAFDDLEKGRLDAAEVESSCIASTAADDGGIKGKLAVAGFLAVDGDDAGTALCAALVRAVDSDSLAVQDIRDFLLSDSPPRRSWAAGRVLRELFFAHESLQEQPSSLRVRP